MQTPTTLNNQQVWGGQDFCYVGSTAEADVQDRTFVLHENQESWFHPSSWVGIVASDSDDLFHPVSGGPLSQIFNLPHISPHHHAYNRTMDTLNHKPLCHPSVTSYNNPSFAILPPCTPLHNRDLSRPPPPIPPHLHLSSVSSSIQLTSIHHPQPA